MSNQTITAHILYRPFEDVVEVDTLEVEVMKDEKKWTLAFSLTKQEIK